MNPLKALRSTFCTFEPIEVNEKFCFEFKTAYDSEKTSTSEIEFIYNDVQIHKFVIGVDDPPYCVPKNEMNMDNDEFKFKVIGTGVSSDGFCQNVLSP